MNTEAIEARQRRAEVKHQLKTGRLTLTDALSDDRAAGVKVFDLIRQLPGFGPVKAAEVCRLVGVPDVRRVRALGPRQRAALISATSRKKW